LERNVLGSEELDFGGAVETKEVELVAEITLDTIRQTFCSANGGSKKGHHFTGQG